MQTRWIKKKCPSCALPFLLDAHQPKVPQKCKRCTLLDGDYTRFVKSFLQEGYMEMPESISNKLRLRIRLSSDRYKTELKTNSMDKVDAWRLEEKRLAQDIADDNDLFKFFSAAIHAAMPKVDHRAEADRRAILRNDDREIRMITGSRRWS